MNRYIYGASGHGKVVLSILLDSGKEITAFIDKNPALKEVKGYPVFQEMPLEVAGSECIIGIGDNGIRYRLANALKTKFLSAVHPTSVVYKGFEANQGTVLMQNTCVQIDTIIGKHVIVNTSASVDHDCQISDFVHVAPNATICGGVTIGEGTLIGAGSTILPNITVGRWAIVGAGAVVCEDIPDFTCVKGVPAKSISILDEHKRKYS